MLTFLLAALALAPQDPGPPGTYSGTARQLDVKVPRFEQPVAIDGHLDEPVWKSAAVLTGFSQYAPSDGVPAADSTQVLVWYSATAIHFGIRAFQPAGTVRATLADRDKISQDDNVTLLLSTFNDGRQAAVFGVNPLGQQADGMLVERGILRQRMGDGAGARADWEHAIELDPDSTTADLAEQNLALLEAGPERR